MAAVFRIVKGVAHGAEDHQLQQGFFRSVGDFFQQLPKMIGTHIVHAMAQGIAEGRDDLRQFQHFFVVGAVVHTVDKGDIPVVEGRGHRFVGGDHTFLDDAFGSALMPLADLHRLPFFVKDHLGFGEIEGQRAAAGAFGGEDFPQRIEVKKQFLQRSVFFRQRGIPVQHGVDIVVSHPRRGADHRFKNIKINDTAFGVDLHGAGEGQPILLGIEAANAVGKLFGQHRQNAVGEIDTGSPTIGFFIQRRAHGHIVPHIGDVNAQQKIPVFRHGQRHGVVEVTGVGAVDGDQRFFSQIPAAFVVFFTDPADGSRRLQDIFRKSLGQLILADHRFHIGAGLILAADDIDDLPFHHPAFFRPGGHLGNDDIAVFGAAVEAFGNGHTAGDPFFLGDHQTAAGIGGKNADDAGIGMGEDLRHFPLVLAVDKILLLHHADEDSVVMEGAVKVRGVNKQIASVFNIGNKEGVAAAFSLDAAGEQPHVAAETVAFLLAHQHETFGLQLPQCIKE